MKSPGPQQGLVCNPTNMATENRQIGPKSGPVSIRGSRAGEALGARCVARGPAPE